MQRVRKSWSETELRRFLELNREGYTAKQIARAMRRTVGAVQGVRRKLARARELGARGNGAVRLLLVSEHRLNRQTKRQSSSSTRARGFRAGRRQARSIKRDQSPN
jgi:hypothetical protein